MPMPLKSSYKLMYMRGQPNRARAGGSQQKDSVNLCEVAQPHSKLMTCQQKQSVMSFTRHRGKQESLGSVRCSQEFGETASIL